MTLIPVLAQMMDRGDMHDGSWGSWWFVGLGVMLLLIALVVVLVLRRVPSGQSNTTGADRPSRPLAEEVLADRHTRGEIDTTSIDSDSPPPRRLVEKVVERLNHEGFVPGAIPGVPPGVYGSRGAQDHTVMYRSRTTARASNARYVSTELKLRALRP